MTEGFDEIVAALEIVAGVLVRLRKPAGFHHVEHDVAKILAAVDAPFFKEAIEIGKFSKEIYKERKRSWLYIDSKEVFLRPKK